MTAIIIILAVLIFLAVLRFGLNLEYSAEGFTVKAKVGPFLVGILPQKKKKPHSPKMKKEKQKRKKRKQKKADSDQKEKDSETEKKKPGGLDELKKMLPPIKKALNRFRKRFLINKITVIFTAAGTDAAVTAAVYGYSNAAIGMLDPILMNAFRIKRRDFRANVDFMAQKSTIYINAAVSLALWEVLYILITLLPLILSAATGKNKNLYETRKEQIDNGQETDK